jgi:hypothetical protein
LCGGLSLLNIRKEGRKRCFENGCRSMALLPLKGRCFLDPIRFGADTESQVQRKGREAFDAELPQDFLIRSDYVSGATLSNFMKAVSTPPARSTKASPHAVQMCFLK